MMNYKKMIIATCALLAWACLSANALEKAPPLRQAQDRPNIVFILADDLGITDVAAFASHFTGKKTDELFYETPHLDKLVSKGIAFSQAYSNPLCSPTRASIMTGKNAARSGFTTATPNMPTYFSKKLPVPEGYSPHDAINHKDKINEQQAWLNGKSNTGLEPSPVNLPNVLDSHHSVFIGKWHLGGHNVEALQPAAHGFDEVPWSMDAGAAHYFTKGSNEYLTDKLTGLAVNFIDHYGAEQKRGVSQKPFFLYLCHFAVHTPLQAPQESIARFANKTQKGTLGHKNAIYAAMIKHLDDSVGRIMTTLKAQGLEENTLIVFASDNGGAEYTTSTDNAPFKGGKATMYEGGVRVPMVYYWPGKYEGGIWCDSVVSAYDHLPTLTAITGNAIPENLDGVDLTGLLADPKAKAADRTIIWHYPYNVKVMHPDYNLPLTPCTGMRKGDYKLIWDWHGKVELYNIVEDAYEKTDLSKQHPEVAQAMLKEIQIWLKKNVKPHYMPQRNPDYDAGKDQRPYPFRDLTEFYEAEVGSLISAQGARKPNIVLLFADDAGYADFGFHGSRECRTPHLDQLAGEGVLCTQAYVSAAVCGPSRAGLLTGRYQQRFGFEENNVPIAMSEAGLTGEDMGLPLSEKTIADHLKAQGYRSILLGKWHQGGADRFHPPKRGFDEFYGFRGGARRYFAYEEGQKVDPLNWVERDFKGYKEHQGYLTNALGDEACAFMERNREVPFFVYLSFNAVHTPMDVRKEDLVEFPHLEGKRKAQAVMMLAMDRACGKVLAKLESLGLADHTLVVFTNDNGGDENNASRNDPLSGVKATHLEGGIRVPFIIKWPGQMKAGSTYAHPVSLLDLLPTFVDASGGDSAAIKGIDGVSLLPYLKRERTDRPHQTLYWKKEVRAAVRDVDWKLIRLPDRPPELYDLSKDISEVTNLAATHPDKVRELYKKLFQWELQLERPIWQLKRKYEHTAMDRYDRFRHKSAPGPSGK